MITFYKTEVKNCDFFCVGGFFVLLIGVLALFPNASFAATGDYTPFSGGALQDKVTGENIAEMINNIFGWLRNIAAVAAVGMITAGGVLYSVSAAVDKKAEAKSMIKDAIFGLILLFGASVILNTVNPQLVSLALLDYGDQSVAGARFCQKGENPKEHNCIDLTQSLAAGSSGCSKVPLAACQPFEGICEQGPGKKFNTGKDAEGFCGNPTAILSEKPGFDFVAECEIVAVTATESYYEQVTTRVCKADSNNPKRQRIFRAPLYHRNQSRDDATCKIYATWEDYDVAKGDYQKKKNVIDMRDWKQCV